MKVNEDSWHWRCYREWAQNSMSVLSSRLQFGRRHLDLCTYTQIVLLRYPLSKVGRFLNGNRWIPSIISFLAIYSVVTYAAIQSSIDSGDPWWYGLVVMPAALLVVAVVVGVATFLESLARKPRSERGEPGLMRSYAKARKRKVCPLIEPPVDIWGRQ